MQIKQIKKIIFNNVSKSQLRNIAFFIQDIKDGKETLSAIRTTLLKDLNKGASLSFNGKNYELGSYLEMFTRTELMNEHIDTTKNVMKDNDLDLIITSQHADSSNVCLPWQNEILSLSGNSNKYKSLNEAIEAGYHHPNCRHLDFPYIPEVAIIPEDFSKKEVRKRDELRNQQRYLERQVRTWKQKEIIGLENANEKIKLYQSRLRKLIKENDFLVRQPYRELI